MSAYARNAKKGVKIGENRDAGELKENDAVPTKDELVLLIMGDPQYHYPCEMTNLECKAASQPIRKNFRLDYFLRPLPPILTNWTEAQDEAIKVESRFANKIQRNSLEKLIRSFPYEPSALIINGDLTNFGHKPQLDEFVSYWQKLRLRFTTQQRSGLRAEHHLCLGRKMEDKIHGILAEATTGFNS
ncbi:unnamed protein product, partial [Mesorhabditis spiculigera]